MNSENIHKERPNKSQLKREMLALKEQAEFLCNLNSKQLSRLKKQNLFEQSILDAFDEFTRLSNPNAQKRHYQFLAKLLSETSNLKEIQTEIHLLQNPHIKQQQRERKLQDSFDKLIQGSKDELDKVLENPGIPDKQQFLQILRNTEKEIKKREDENSAEIGKQEKKLKSLLREIISQEL